MKTLRYLLYSVSESALLPEQTKDLFLVLCSSCRTGHVQQYNKDTTTDSLAQQGIKRSAVRVKITDPDRFCGAPLNRLHKTKL